MTTDNANQAKYATAIVIDDDHDIVDTLAEHLELRGIHVLGKGYNGNDAVILYEKFVPDVVFLDVMMPDYTGLYALEKIMQINSDAKVIILTADVAEATEHKLIGLGASYILYKPMELDGLKMIGAKMK